MAARAFKYFSIAAGGTPQPLVGTTLGAAVQIPSSSDTLVSLAVADSSMFLAGDLAILGSPGTSEERVQVTAVPDATHVTVRGVQKAHASGSFLRLSLLMNSLFIQTKDGNAGPIFVGMSNSLDKVTGAFVIAKLFNVALGGQPTEFGTTPTGVANSEDLGQIWVDGTTNDSYLPSVGTT